VCVCVCVRVLARRGRGGGSQFTISLCDCSKIKRMYNFGNCSHVLSLWHLTMQYDNGEGSLCKKWSYYCPACLMQCRTINIKSNYWNMYPCRNAVYNMVKRGGGVRIIAGNLAKEALPRFSLLIFKFHFTWNWGVALWGLLAGERGRVTEPRLTNWRQCPPTLLHCSPACSDGDVTIWRRLPPIYFFISINHIQCYHNHTACQERLWKFLYHYNHYNRPYSPFYLHIYFPAYFVALSCKTC
jgi:hypothetical protein